MSDNTFLLVEEIKELLSHIGFSAEELNKWDTTLSLAVIILIAITAGAIIYRITVLASERLLKHKKYELLSMLIKYKALGKLAHLIPPIIINALLPLAFAEKSLTLRYTESLVWIYFIIFLVASINAVLNSLGASACSNRKYHDRPIKGFIQITKVIVYIIAVITGISILTNKSPLYLIGGLGAFAAVLMLVTKDSIMGFVGGFLLLENDMVRLGDWIEVEGTNINGTVFDISLTVVKVQNFDNTIVTIPPYSLINNSFTNWRGMNDSGGRRIARGYTVKVDNIVPCSKELLRRVRGINGELDNFIACRFTQGKECATANDSAETNMGLFRVYADIYLRSHPRVRNDMLIMVRTLAPTESGLPIQFYCFTATTDWAEYENIQAGIMEHFAAIMPRFGLYPFQAAGSRDTIIGGLLESNFPVEHIAGMPFHTTK